MAINWPEIEYVEAEDGMLDPKLDYPKQPAGNVGKYGEMRRSYLQEHHKARYTMMMLLFTQSVISLPAHTLPPVMSLFYNTPLYLFTEKFEQA